MAVEIITKRCALKETAKLARSLAEQFFPQYYHLVQKSHLGLETPALSVPIFFLSEPFILFIFSLTSNCKMSDK